MKYEKSNKCSKSEKGRRMCACDGKILGEYPRYINSFYDFVIMTIDFHISALSLKYKKKAFELIGNIEKNKIGKRYRGPLLYLLHELKIDEDEEEFDYESESDFGFEPDFDFNRYDLIEEIYESVTSEVEYYFPDVWEKDKRIEDYIQRRIDFILESEDPKYFIDKIKKSLRRKNRIA